MFFGIFYLKKKSKTPTKFLNTCIFHCAPCLVNDVHMSDIFGFTVWPFAWEHRYRTFQFNNKHIVCKYHTGWIIKIYDYESNNQNSSLLFSMRTHAEFQIDCVWIDVLLIWNWSLQGNVPETNPTRPDPDEVAVKDGGEAQVSVINE